LKIARGKNKEIVRDEKYILKDKKLRVEIIWLHHNMLIARYRGR